MLRNKAHKKVEQQSGDVQRQKSKIIERLEDSKLRIVISIDDIDRLSEEEIIAVFQVVKALADFPKTIYLLAFDYDVVINALSKVQSGKGKAYLEKIVQVPIQIPMPNMSSIFESFISKLSAILDDSAKETWNKETWTLLSQFGLKKYINTIRDVIRLTNVFSLKYQPLKEETDALDLLGLTCLQVFEPFVYSRLSQHKAVLCGTDDTFSYGKQEAIDQLIRNTMEAIIPNENELVNSEAARNIICILFPKIKSISPNTLPGYSIGSYNSYPNSYINNKVSASWCFDRYFSLTLEDDAIPTTTIKHLIYEANEHELEKGISRLYQDGKIVRLLDEIDAYTRADVPERITSERAIVMIKCLSRQWNTFIDVDEQEFYDIPFAWRYLLCVGLLLKAIDCDKQYPLIRALFMDNNIHPATLASLLNDFETQHGRFTDSSADNKRLITLEEVVELEQIFKVRAIAALASREVLLEHNGLGFLWMLEQIDPELTERKKREIITDDRLLTKVVSYCTSQGKTATPFVKKIWKISLNLLGEFIDVEEAHQRMRSYVNLSEFRALPQNEKMSVIAFLIFKEKKTEITTIREFIGEEAILKELDKLSIAD